MSGETNPEVLIIHTGGTIGMKKTADKVLAPAEKGYLEEEVKHLSYLHDQRHFEEKPKPGYLITGIYKDGKKDKRVLYKIHEVDRMLDSSNMKQADWIEIADLVKSKYKDYDGFVILHGTDTMAYGAAFLSFAFENLDKPVVLTGSQIPIGELRSDGPKNILLSLMTAAFSKIPMVLLCFGDHVLQGNRAIKFDATSISPFITPHCDPLVTFGVEMTVNYRSDEGTKQTYPKSTVAVNEGMGSANVAIVPIFPGISGIYVKAVVDSLKKPAGIVLQTYGAGNAPTDKEFLDEIKKASKQTILVNATQCARGSVEASYEVGKELENAGVIPGGDMTSEAAFAKLCYVLGFYEAGDKIGEKEMEDIKQYSPSYLGHTNLVDLINLAFKKEGWLEMTTKHLLTFKSTT